jgi:hypothetical protein
MYSTDQINFFLTPPYLDTDMSSRQTRLDKLESINLDPTE